MWEACVASTLNSAAERAKRTGTTAASSASQDSRKESTEPPSGHRGRSSTVVADLGELELAELMVEISRRDSEMSDLQSVDDSESEDGDQRLFVGEEPTGGAGGSTDSFVLVAKEHLVGIWLAVFVRSSLVAEVSDIRTGERGWFVDASSRGRGTITLREAVNISNDKYSFTSFHH